MKKCSEPLGTFYQTLCNAQSLAQELKHPCLEQLTETRVSVGQDVLKDMEAE